jgi:nitric oxide dioxygenase
MRLTDHDAHLVRASFHTLSADPLGAARAFYTHLYRIAPHTRDLFVVDLDRQATKLMNTLSVTVSYIEDWSTLTPILEDLAMRHLAYGVQQEHYPLVGRALQEMFSERLGDQWTAEAATAWRRLYAAMEDVMTAAAYPARFDDDGD